MINPKVTCSKTHDETLCALLTTQYGLKMVLSEVSASSYRQSTLVPVLLDVINMWKSCPKFGQIRSKNLAGAGLGRICQKGPDAGPATAKTKIRYIPSY